MVLPEVQEVPAGIVHSRDEAWRGSTSIRELEVPGLWDDDDAADEGVGGPVVAAASGVAQDRA